MSLKGFLASRARWMPLTFATRILLFVFFGQLLQRLATVFCRPRFDREA